jgi:translation initiation factor 5B
MGKIRSPILVMLGHVDHGKTTLLDKIRGTAVVKGEAGAITQHTSASYIPTNIIKENCGILLESMGTKLSIPGLLWVDTPGHAAFTTLRKRGGAIADLAVLIVDVNEGFQPQTEESLNYLKQFKTPFVVALTKIDTITGWNPTNDDCFLNTYKNQTDRVREELDDKMYRVIGQLVSKGFSAERYDRVPDYTKQVAVIPVSGKTGEGVPDLLMILAGVAQKYLEKGLEVTPGEGKGTVLEVKEYKGLGMTIDVILYDGEIKKGDTLVIGSMGIEKIIQTKVKALLEPNPLKEIRLEKEFKSVDSVIAAAGIKIAAPGLEDVIAGSPVRAVRDRGQVEAAKSEVEKEIEEVEIETGNEGALVKADTLGSLEALTKTFRELNIPIRKAHVGTITKADINELRAYDDPLIFAFNVKISPEIIKLAKDNRIALFHSDIIYRLVDMHDEWVKDRKKREEDKILDSLTRPGRVRVLKGFVFRQRKPAVFGVEVDKGIIKPGYKLINKAGGEELGEIREVQSQGDNVQEAKKGERVALSMNDVTIGKNVNEGDVLETLLTRSDIEGLKKVSKKLTPEERDLMEEKEEEE